jgi:hypothetical protein
MLLLLLPLVDSAVGSSLLLGGAVASMVLTLCRSCDPERHRGYVHLFG